MNTVLTAVAAASDRCQAARLLHAPEPCVDAVDAVLLVPAPEVLVTACLVHAPGYLAGRPWAQVFAGTVPDVVPAVYATASALREPGR